MKLKKVCIHKYKSVESEQRIDIDPFVTVLVGMNEAGKTSVLEAVAKTNYFQKDEKFEFSLTHDYPRREKKGVDKSGSDPAAITCTYELVETEVSELEELYGENVLPKEWEITSRYSGKQTWGVSDAAIDLERFWKFQQTKVGISNKSLISSLAKCKSVDELREIAGTFSENGNKEKVESFVTFFENKWGWDNPIQEFIARTCVKPRLPKYLYYDEYYSLPSRISIEKLQSETLDTDSLKTAKALFELADISVDEIVKAESFEDFIAELEATEAIISGELFDYWSTNSNLSIRFAIDKKIDKSNPSKHHVVEHVLDIRVHNSRTGVSLPLQNRSKGFNWFFSFLVWFKRIQEQNASSYVLLLDEPGLNLHASAQADLLRFIESLSAEYQVVFTTHSPFMIEPSRLHRVRTVVETEQGTKVSESVQEKDPRTLFPLQAALGYDLAQNLFVSPKNLLVEGVSDLVVLQHISTVLQASGREGLAPDVSIVPTGGLDRVATFISLLRGSKLMIACLLDTPKDQKSKTALERMISERMITARSVVYFNSFIAGSAEADLEDLFEPSEYIRWFNEAFAGEHSITEQDVAAASAPRIVDRIAQVIGRPRFNHYRPARLLAMTNPQIDDATLDRFEAAFAAMNRQFQP